MPELLIRDARVVDVRDGGTQRADVLVDAGGRIEQVVPLVDGAGEPAEPVARAVRRGVTELAGGGRWLVPGFVTVHTHLSIVFPFSDTDEHEDPAVTRERSLQRARDALRAGATTVRCIHEQHAADVDLVDHPPAEPLPRIVAGGRALSAPGGHGQGTGSRYCSGPAEFAAAAAAELDGGARHVKIFITGGLAHAGESPADPEMTRDEMAAVVRTAERYGARVVAHAGHHTAIRDALDAGVTSFEHAYEVDDETAALLAGPDLFVSPTLLVSHSQETMAALGFEQHSRDNARRVAPIHLASARRLVAAGVTLTHGTDYPPGQVVQGRSAIATEAVLLQQAGLSPLQALRAVTLDGARVCRLEDTVGTVEVGRRADLVLLGSDPTADAAALGDVLAVVRDGAVVHHAGDAA